MSADSETQIVTLIGSKPGNLSQVMHNAAYEHLGLNFLYIPLAIPSIANLETVIKGLRAISNFRGSSVTMPYKEEVMLYLDRIDEVAREIGAVNTIVKEGTALVGYNTDWIGAMEALKEETDLEGKTVVLAGAGGAARAIAYGLKENKARVIVFNRHTEGAEKLAEKFKLEFGGRLEDIANLMDYDILINATSVGAYPNFNESIVEEAVLKEGKIVMDIVAKPLDTKLLQMTEQKGCSVIPGYKMLVYQAVPQFKLFTGHDVAARVMEWAVLDVLE